MNKPAAILLAIAAIAVGGWLALRPPDLPPIVAAEPGARAAPPVPASPPPPASLAASDVLKIDPRAIPARPVVKPPPPTLFNEYLGSRNYRAIYDRLNGSAEGETAEGRLVLYEILRQCATITEGRRPGAWRPTPPKRDDFVAGIAPTDPNREKRIAAFDEFTADRCGGLAAVSITQAALGELLKAAADAGDPRARAISIEQELWQARRAAGGGRGGRDGGVTLSDGQLDTLRELAATRDPEAIRVVGRVMANSWHDVSLRIGAEQQPVEQRALMNAFLVVACEYGAPCGTDTPRMLQACALRGHCDAQNYPDYLYYYGSSPHDSQLLVQYRSVLRDALETGNWSQLTVVRGAPPPVNRMTFVPGPR